LTSRSIPLSAQLLIAFVGLVGAMTVVLSIAAYRSSLDALVAEAMRDAGEVAQARERTLAILLDLRQRRAEGFLLSVEAICGEPAGARGFGFSEECVRIMVDEMRMTERASSAVLTFRGRTLRTSGAPIAPGVPRPDAVALVVPRGPGESDLIMQAVHGDAVLRLQFDSEVVLPFFDDREDLGRVDDLYLTDPDGRFLTPVRYAGAARGTPPGADFAEPLHECRAFAGETLGIDYRGVQTIHGFRPVQSIGGGCIDAHIPYSTLLAAAEQIRSGLITRGALFGLVGVMLSLIAANRIAAPVRRLARSARAIQGGKFSEPIPVGGPSEVRALGRALRSMAGELTKLVTTEQSARLDAESANRSKDKFLAIVSHELRTPLNAVLGWTRLLSTGYLNEQRTRRALDAIERNAEAQQQLIEDLLDVSRIVAGRLRMERAPVRLVPEAEAAIETIRPLVIDKKIQLDSRFEEDLVVAGDAQRIRQIVWNVVSNAVKFTPAEGLVSVTLRRQGTDAELIVRDSGIGIAPDVLPHIFEWFRQADGNVARQETGLGLGLGLVKQLVDLHGGSVVVESAGEGKGTTFIVRLPLGDGESVTSGE
jgi:signal transduction histidine kinase